MEALRSLLFVPGNRPDMLEKAARQPADALVPDLEDSVPVAEKERAREIVREALASLAQRGQLLLPRINSFSSGLARQDIAGVVGPHTFGIVAPKIESRWDLEEVSRLLAEAEERAGVAVGRTRIIPLLESALGILQAYDICRATPRVVGVAVGIEDYTVDAGIRRTETGEETIHPRRTVALAANAARVLPLDTPNVNFRDVPGLEKDIRAVLPMGYKGKFAIHPSQVEVINRLFSPSPEEVEYARRVVQVFQEAEARGRGAAALDGKMIDIPIVVRARNLLAFAESIRRQQGQA